MTAMTFTCDLEVPRTGEETGVPTAWLQDEMVPHGAFGVLVRLLVQLAPGEIATDRDLESWRHPGDPSVVETVQELREAGYLRRTADNEGESYALVHPDRLGPLSAP